MKTILMTGGSGFIGSNFINYPKDNFYIVNLGRSGSNADSNLNWDMEKQNLSDTEINVNVQDVDTILHCGAIVGEQEIDTIDYFNVNVRSTIDLLDYAVENKVKNFVYISTGGVYSREMDACIEEDRCDPVGIYNITKYTSEKICREYERYYGINLLILRPFFPYGVGCGTQQRGRMIPRIIDLVKNKLPVIINQNYTPRINPIHIDDMSFILNTMISNKTCGTYNVSGQITMSVFDMVEYIGKCVKILPIYRIRKEKGFNIMGSNNKLMCNNILPLNYRMKTPEDGIKELVDGSK